MEPANLLKIKSLNDGWRDKDSVLLHACFQLLEDFVEDELPRFPHINWTVTENRMNISMKGIQFNGEEQAPDDSRDIKKEILELYDWWQVWKQEMPGDKTNSFNEDHALYEKENEMLKKLIDLRMYLWT